MCRYVYYSPSLSPRTGAQSSLFKSITLFLYLFLVPSRKPLEICPEIHQNDIGVNHRGRDSQPSVFYTAGYTLSLVIRQPTLSSSVILASLNSVPLHLVSENLSIFMGFPYAPFSGKHRVKVTRDDETFLRVSRHVIYAADTMKPVYANIIAVELVWQHARSRVLLNLATTTRISGALVSMYQREYHREYTCSLKFSSGERFKVPVQWQIIRTDVFWHVTVDVSRHRTGRIRD